MTTTTAPKQTTINLLMKGVPGGYRSDVTRLKNALGTTIASDDTPFDITLIEKHIGGFQHDWVKSHTSVHYKGAPVTTTPTPSTPEAPAEAGVMERAMTAVTDAAKRVIGGKTVPPADPNGVITESATTTISARKDGNVYTGSVHLTLGKMQQTMLSDFANTIPEGTPARDFFTKLSTGTIDINVAGASASTQVAVDPQNLAADSEG